MDDKIIARITQIGKEIDQLEKEATQAENEGYEKTSESIRSEQYIFTRIREELKTLLN